MHLPLRRPRSVAAALLALAAGTLTVAGTVPAASASASVDHPLQVAAPLVGARTPFVSMQAEEGRTNGTVIGPDWAYGTASAEAAGRRAVLLAKQGDYVEFRLRRPANAVNLRYSIPDSPDGAGQDAKLGVQVNGRGAADLAVTSRYSWYHGVYPWSNNPADGGPRQRFDDARMRFDHTLPAGTTVRFVVGANAAPSTTIDVADFEEVPAPLPAPKNAIDVTTLGADPTGKTDAAPAIQRALDQGAAAHRPVYLPPGTFSVSRHLIVDGVDLIGAGTWYSTLHGLGVGVYGKDAPTGSSNVHLAHFAIFGETTNRDDSAQVNGIGGAMNHSTVTDLWIQHTKVGAWMDGPMTDLQLSGLRILDQTADGVNFHLGVTDSSVSNSFVRGTGDDGLAMWSDKQADARNRFANNTVSNPTLANTIAIYGGHDNVVEGNHVSDTLTEGGGVQVANRFGAVPLSGTTTVRGNLLERTGSLGLFSHIGWGAVWFWAGDSAMTGRVEVSRNIIRDSAYEAIQAYGDHPVSNVHVSDTLIDGTGTFAVQTNTAGSGDIDRVLALRLKAGARYDCSSGFTLTITRSFGLRGSTCGYPAPGPLKLSAESLKFASTGLGVASDPQTIVVTNTSRRPQPIASITTTGSYQVHSDCPAQLPGGASCTISVTFVPTAGGDRGGAVTVSDGTSAGRYQVYLTGAITAPTAGDVLRGTDATVTSAVGGYGGPNLTDADPATYWESAPDAFPQAATVSLGVSREISTVRLRLPDGWGARVEGIGVEGTSDGKTWRPLVPVADRAFDPTTGNAVDVTFDRTAVTGLRVTVTSNTGWTAAQLSEIEAYR